MKKTVTMFRLLLLAGLLFGLTKNVQAQTTSAMGSDLTYVNVAPNIYQVNFKLYRDCTGSDPGSDQILTYRAAGCDTTSRTITLNRVGIPVTGTPYCANTPMPPCNGTDNLLANYQEHTYQGTVTLPSQCLNWILSISIANRPHSRNLANGQATQFYTEALINNVATQTNNSPTFGNIPIPFVLVDQLVTYNQSITDLDGDSIVFSLVPAWSNFNTPVVYGNFTGTGTGVNPYPAGVSPAGTVYSTANFSATNPIISRNPLTLDPITGMMVFEPMDYKGAPFTSEQGLNKYTVAIQVDEYRKIGGVPVKIGHLRREIMLVVVTLPPPSPSPISPFTSKGQPVQPVYEISALEPACLSFTASTTRAGDPNNRIVITTNAMQIIPFSMVHVTGSDTVKTITICWRPRLEDIRATPYIINLVARNNDCPVPQFVSQPIEIRVVKRRITNPGPVEITDPSQPGVSRQALSNQPIPNIITPNGDGLNDAFVIPNLPAEAELQLFDRKHKLIRTFKHYQNDWQGEGVKDGVYYYILKDKETGEVTKGQVTVVR